MTNIMDAKSNSYTIELKGDITQEHVDYLSKQPEIQELLSQFMSLLAIEKPRDIIAYTKEYFNSIKAEEEVFVHVPLVIVGPSGVGKGTLIKWLMQTQADKFELSVSYTTRNRRADELHGREYYFVSKEEFMQEVAKDKFLEHGLVHGNYYGTHKDVIHNIAKKGKICLLEIDVVATKKIYDSGIKCNTIFLMPPKIEILRDRMIKRGMDNKEVIATRMTNAEKEIKFYQESNIFDHCIINDNLDDAKKELLNLINRLYPSFKNKEQSSQSKDQDVRKEKN